MYPTVKELYSKVKTYLRHKNHLGASVPLGMVAIAIILSAGLIFQVKVLQQQTQTVSQADEPVLFQAVPSLDNGLVSYWNFDESSGNIAADIKNTNNGTVTGTTVVDGRFGKARTFTNDGEKVDMGTNRILSPSDNFTVSAWIKSADYKEDGSIVRRNLDGPGNNPAWELYYENKSNSFSFAVLKTGNDWFYCDSKTHPQTNTWYQLTGMYDHNSLRIYVNGVLENTCPQTGQVNIDGARVTAGIFTTSGISWKGGTIDEVGIWNRLLSGEEILSLANGAIPKSVSSALTPTPTSTARAITEPPKWDYGSECTAASHQFCSSKGYQGGCWYVRGTQDPGGGTTTSCLYGASQTTCTQSQSEKCAGTNGCKVISPYASRCLYSANQSCTSIQSQDAARVGMTCTIKSDHVEGYHIAYYLYPATKTTCDAYDTQLCQDRGYSSCTVDATTHDFFCSNPTSTPSCTGYDEANCAGFGQVCELNDKGQSRCKIASSTSPTPTSGPNGTPTPTPLANSTPTPSPTLNPNQPPAPTVSAAFDCVNQNQVGEYVFHVTWPATLTGITAVQIASQPGFGGDVYTSRNMTLNGNTYMVKGPGGFKHNDTDLKGSFQVGKYYYVRIFKGDSFPGPVATFTVPSCGASSQ